tara:strand:- start:9 stop:989 length:981 start_codon:yes stop_codon:yes gene_type:complete
MNYKVMKRPMFKMGGPTSGGTGITSGLETPRQNFAYSTYGEAVQAIPKMFEKTMTGLENRRSAIGPMALLQAAQSGAFSGVENFGDLAMAIGSPEFLGAGLKGMESSQKLDSQIDALGLKEATTMATLLKKKDSAFSTRLQSQAAVKEIQRQINDLRSQLVGQDDPAMIKTIKQQIGDLNTQMKVFISGGTIREKAIELLMKGDNPSLATDEESIQEMIGILQGYSMKEGGRINKQMGGGFDMAQEQPMQAAQTMAPGPEMMQPQGQDPFTILRSRLPREISDEVVSLIAYNKKAFADFANIQDQDDVDLFNQKYNVQLVVDLASR